MKPPVHFTLSLINCSFIYLYTKSIIYSIINFFVGIFIDLDHLIDFIISKPKYLFDINDFLSGNFIKKSRKIYLFLHSYELLLLIIISTLIDFINLKLCISITSAFIFHMIIDQIGNNVYPFTYFITYRIIKKFDTKYLKKYVYRKCN